MKDAASAILLLAAVLVGCAAPSGSDMTLDDDGALDAYPEYDIYVVDAVDIEASETDEWSPPDLFVEVIFTGGPGLICKPGAWLVGRTTVAQDQSDPTWEEEIVSDVSATYGPWWVVLMDSDLGSDTPLGVCEVSFEAGMNFVTCGGHEISIELQPTGGYRVADAALMDHDSSTLLSPACD